MVNIVKVAHNAIAFAFVKDMANDACFVITHQDQFRGHSFYKIIWLKTPTIEAMNIARACLPPDTRFHWACAQPDMFLCR